MQLFWLKFLLPLLSAALLLNPHTPLWMALVTIPLLLLIYARHQRLFLLSGLVLILCLGTMRWLLLAPPVVLNNNSHHHLSGQVRSAVAYPWGTRITLQKAYLLTDDGRRAIPGHYQLICKQTPDSGDRIHFEGTFQQLSLSGDTDWRWRGHLRGIIGEFIHVKQLQVVPGVEPWHLRMQNLLLNRLGRQLSGKRLEIAGAMLLGARDQLSVDLKQQFVQAGIIHLLAVSGLHVGFIAAIVLGVLRLLPISRKWCWFLLPISLSVYALICGGRPSIIRAVLMATLYFWGQALERGVTPLQSLLASATLIGLHNPLQIFSVGFQLSHLAMLAVLLALNIRTPGGKMLDRLLRPILISLSCFVLLAPLILYYFGRLSPIGILANLPAIPLTAVITGQGALLLACADLPIIADVTGSSLNLSLRCLEWLTSTAATAPGSSWQLVQPSLVQLLLIMLVMVLLLVPGIRRRLNKLILLVLAVGTVVWWQYPRHQFEIAAINVGQGDAIFLQSPGGHTTLIDAGVKRGRLDQGHLHVVPYLRAQGVDRLDLIVLTHADMDHMGGIPSVLREVGCDTICLADVRIHRHFREIMEICDSIDTAVRMVAAGEILVREPGYCLYLLSPPQDWVANSNERSIVLKAVHGDCSALLTGDAGEKSERMLVANWDEFLHSDLLKLGHHGSNTASCGEFLEQVSPEYGLISCGRNNRYGHPATEVLERFDQKAVQLCRTDVTGTLELTSDGRRWQLQPVWWQRSLGEYRSEWSSLTEKWKTLSQ